MIKNYGLFTKKTIPKFVGLLFLLLAVNMASLFATYLTGIYVDLLNSKVSKRDIWVYAETLIALGITSVVINYVYKYCAGKMQYNLAFQIQSRVILHMQHVPLIVMERFEPNYISKRIIDDASTITAYIIENSGLIVVHAIRLAVSSILLYKMNQLYFYIVLLSTPLYFFLYWIVKKPLYSFSKQFTEETAIYFERCVRQVSIAKRIKLSNLFIKARERLNGFFKHYLHVAIKYALIANLFNSIDVICEQILRCVVIVVGGMLVIDEKITIGYFIVSMTYFGFVVQSVKYYFSLSKSYQTYKVARDRINELMMIPEEKTGEGMISQISHICVSDVCFRYNRNAPQILDNFTYSFNLGSSYCIKGGNGTGKSTLLHILTGLLQPDDGQITYNNTSLECLNLYQMLEKNIGFCFQDEKLPNITLRDWLNLLGNNAQMNDSESNRILNRFVNCNGFSIEHSLDKLLGQFSGGEKQKIILYSVLLKKPGVILLDEPSAGLDFESACNLIEYLNSIKKETIIICVTHDDHFAEAFDEIIYFDI